ncbi:MAG: DUF6268 family outer membrane beta-barrel protein [Bacteroidia bacterium]
MFRKITLIFSLSVFVVTYSFAQFHNEKFLRSKLSLSYENQPERDFSTIDSKYKSVKYAMGFKLPLLNRVGKGGDQGAFKLTGLVFNLKASRTDQEITFLNENHRLYHAGGGLDFIYFPGRKILYLANFNVNIFQDNYVSGSPDFRYTGFFLMNYKASKIVSLKAGLSYSFLFGRGVPLPLIGAGFHFKSGTNINILLPYYFSVAQKLNSQSVLTLSLKPDGSVYDFANKGNFIGYDPVVQLRQRCFKIALNYAIEFNENVKFFIEGGLIGNTTVSFSDAKITDKETFFEADVDNGFFGKAGFIFSFGEAPKWGKQNGVNFMLDYDVNDTEMKE